MKTSENPCHLRPKCVRRNWPWLLFYVAAVLIVGLLNLNSRGSNNWSQGILIGLEIGLALSLGMIGGLFGRNWLAGIWLTSLLSFIGVTVVQFSSAWKFSDSSIFSRGYWQYFQMPFFIFSIAMPFLMLRVFCGWQLTTVMEPLKSRRRISSFDLLLTTTVLAALLYMTRPSQLAMQLPPTTYWLSIGPTSLVIGVLSLLGAVPATWCLFRMESRRWRWVASLSLSAIAILLVMYAVMRLSGTGGLQWKLLISATFIGSVVLVVGLELLKFGGYNLSQYSSTEITALQSSRPQSDKEHFTVDSPFAGDSSPTSYSQARQVKPIDRGNLAWVGGTLVVSLASTFAASVYEHNLLTSESDLISLSKQASREGGDLVFKNNHQLERIALAPGATDEDLREFSKFNTITGLSLANTRISDKTLEMLPKWFPKLQRLDLGHTSYTTASLAHLSELTDLRTLGLAGTKLSIDEINLTVKNIRSSSKSKFAELDLSESKLSPDDLLLLDSHVGRLVIRGMNFGDNEIARLTTRTWGKLDISRNPINGSGINFGNISWLVAHDTPLTDANFPTNSALQWLEFSNTKLTDQSAGSILQILSCSLGPGEITNAGLQASVNSFTDVRNIAVHDPACDCGFIAKLTEIQTVDLSNSGVTDESLARIASTWKNLEGLRVLTLSLRNTAISDRGILALNGLSISFLDVRNTRVTDQGLKQLSLANEPLITVGHTQFSPHELKTLRNHCRVAVDLENPYDCFNLR